MPWRGSFVPIPGLLTGFVSVITEVYQFDLPNALSKVTWRVLDAPAGGTVVLRAHDSAAGDGDFITATIADGENFVTVTPPIPLPTGVGLWQEVESESGAAMSLSGEYEMASASGISVFFTDLATVKRDAKITDTVADRDLVLNHYIEGVTRAMQDWMGRDIVQGTVVAEKIDGDGFDTVNTRHWPIISITSLDEDGVALVEDTDFEITENDKADGLVVRISGTATQNWLAGRRNIKLTYDHGFIAVPPSLVQAATALVVAKFFETRQSGQAWRGLTTKGVDPNAATNYDKEIWIRETVPAMKPFELMRL
jgi:hypothetical protein